MTDKPASSAEAAARLLAAFERPDPLSHEEAQSLLQAYVADELAGVDVDSAPEYADLTRHLERCAVCLALYEELSLDMATMLAEGNPLPEPPISGDLATTARQTERMLLRVFAGLKRRFEAIFQIPRLEPQFAALSGGQRAILLNEQLPEVEGEPAVSISVGGAAGARDLLVAVSDDREGGAWEVQLTLGEVSYSATTDDRGIVRFGGLTIDEADQLTILLAEAD